VLKQEKQLHFWTLSENQTQFTMLRRRTVQSLDHELVKKFCNLHTLQTISSTVLERMSL